MGEGVVQYLVKKLYYIFTSFRQSGATGWNLHHSHICQYLCIIVHSAKFTIILINLMSVLSASRAYANTVVLVCGPLKDCHCFFFLKHVAQQWCLALSNNWFWQRQEYNNFLSSFRLLLLSILFNPLRGHQSISIESDLGALYFGNYGYHSIVIFLRACSWEPSDPVDALKRPSHSRKSCRFGPLKLWFSSSSRPSVDRSCTQFLSSCLACSAWSERFASAQFQLRSRWQRGLEVSLST